MKPRIPWPSLIVALAGVVLAWLTIASARAQEKQPVAAMGSDDAPFAVVELFTSEGCSSCPPAEALLNELVRDARKDGRRVFCLAFHVDYWNRLGWRDKFSDAAFSQRQSAYSAAWKKTGVYTPQAVINGSDEFVGSDRDRARRSIDAALKKVPAVPLKWRAVKEAKSSASDATTLTFRYEVASVPKGAVLNVALVERGLETRVGSGENSGRTLRHENVVRAFRALRVDASGRGEVDITPPADLVRKNASAIAYVEEAGTKAVLAAAAVDLTP